jgi:hypothetical protein
MPLCSWYYDRRPTLPTSTPSHSASSEGMTTPAGLRLQVCVDEALEFIPEVGIRRRPTLPTSTTPLHQPLEGMTTPPVGACAPLVLMRLSTTCSWNYDEIHTAHVHTDLSFSDGRRCRRSGLSRPAAGVCWRGSRNSYFEVGNYYCGAPHCHVHNVTLLHRSPKA